MASGKDVGNTGISRLRGWRPLPKTVIGAGTQWLREGRWLGVLSVLSIVLAWYLSSALSLAPASLLPGPGEV